MMARAWCLAPVAVVMLAVPLGAQTPPARGNAPSRPAPPSLQPSGYDPGQRRDPFVSLLKTGQDAGRGVVYQVGLLVAAAQAVWHVGLIRHRQREDCFRAFRANHWLGMTVWVGTVLDFALA